MPAEQRGSAYKTRKGFAVRWRANGRSYSKAGFGTKTAALAYFRDEIRPQLDSESSIDPSITLTNFVKLYLEAHGENLEASSLTILTSRLKPATAKFGDVPLEKLEQKAPEIARWRTTLAEGSRYGVTQALRQTLEQAVKWGVITKNPAKLAGSNPQPKRSEIEPFTHADIGHICDELRSGSDTFGATSAAITRFAAETGLRPCEWLALKYRDIKRDEGVVLVERSVSRGVERSYGKTARSRRRVPLSRAALESISMIPPRIDGGPLFLTPAGAPVELHNWRKREWSPALIAAGVGHGTIYTLRHTFATNALAAGISIFELARTMGTSIEMIDKTYGHLAAGSEESIRARLDAFVH